MKKQREEKETLLSFSPLHNWTGVTVGFEKLKKLADAESVSVCVCGVSDAVHHLLGPSFEA